MKILVLNYEYPPIGGGASPISAAVARGYASRSHSVHVLTMGFAHLPKKEEEQGVIIHRVPCLRKSKDICSPLEQLTYLFSAAWYFHKHMRKLKFDLVHAHFIIPTAALALWLKYFYGLKYVVTSHGSDVLFYNPRFKFLYPWLKYPWKKILQGSELLITPSRFLGKRIELLVGPIERKEIPNGISESSFLSGTKEKYILCVSRLFQNKGIQDLLKAVAKMDLGSWKVVIVGEGPYRAQLEQLSEELQLTDKVTFTGWIDNSSAKMAELYAHAPVFVLPSYFENMSVSILEARASRCHVIAANTGGNPEVVLEENLYTPGDVEKLRMLLEKNMKRASVLPPQSDFTQSRMVEEYDSTLKRVANL